MSIEAVSGKGVSRARVICDECGRDDIVAADYVRGNAARFQLNEGQVKRKITAHGWSDVKGTIRCPTCEAKRKVVSMADVKAQQEVEVEQPREPTRAQKREIMDLLESVYDVEAGHYLRGDTDETVADVLKVLPGWVTRIREEFFGEDGGNGDIAALIAENAKWVETVQAALKTHEAAAAECRVEVRRGQEIGEKLEAIRKAVGPRALQRAKA